MNKFKKYITEPWRLVVAFDRHIASIVPDKLFIKCYYRCINNKKLNFKNPIGFEQKLSCLKIYDRNPLYHILTDKIKVREYIQKKFIDTELKIIPLIQIWQTADEIDFSVLPDKFVMKCTHDSGSVIVCTDKSSLDENSIKQHFEKCLKRNFYKDTREFAYKGIKPCIIVEQYLYENDDISVMPDIKTFCFDGKVKAYQVNIGRNSTDGVAVRFFNEKGEVIPVVEAGGYSSSNDVSIDDDLRERIILLAEKMSQNIPHVRVDFLVYKNEIYFSEFTFYHCGGLFPIKPEEWNLKFGSWINIPKK
jgi:hypothetical protein